MTTAEAVTRDAAGRPLADGPYEQTPDEIRREAQRLADGVRDGRWPVALLRSYLGDSVEHAAWAATLLAEVESDCA